MKNGSREEILNRVRAGLHGSSAQKKNTPSNAYKNRDFTKEADEIYVKNGKNNDALIEQFINEAENVNANVQLVETDDGARKFLLNFITDRGISSFSIWETDELKRIGTKKLLRENGLKTVTARNKDRIAGADIGITGADYAIADTGTIVLLTDKNRPRSVSLLPPTHVAIVKSSNIVSNIRELFIILHHRLDADQDITSCMTFITGPSRTADIELNLTLGVHGPKELHLLVID